MPWDYMRSVKVAGAAMAVDYVVGAQLVGYLPASAQGSDDNMKSAVRTAVAVTVADLVMQNL
jgi:hypothetical protein